MQTPSFTMNYTLVSNDGVEIEFSADQLEFCDYARNILTDVDGSWILSVDDPLCVPPMNHVELRALHTFLRIRVEEMQPPKIREGRPVITACPVYMLPNRLQIARFIYLPPRISINTLQNWSTYCTGLGSEYHRLLDETLPGLVHTEDESEASVMRRWIRFARFLGCADLQYLLEARFLWHVSEAMERHAGVATTRYMFEPDYLEKTVQIVSRIMYLDDEDYDMVYMKRLKDYVMVFWALRDLEPDYVAYIVRYYLEHRGPPMPQLDWTADEWAVYRATMQRLYEEAHNNPDVRRETDLHPFAEFRNYPIAVEGDWHE